MKCEECGTISVKIGRLNLGDIGLLGYSIMIITLAILADKVCSFTEFYMLQWFIVGMFLYAGFAIIWRMEDRRDADSS